MTETQLPRCLLNNASVRTFFQTYLLQTFCSHMNWKSLSPNGLFEEQL